jgi:hypothetical protein
VSIYLDGMQIGGGTTGSATPIAASKHPLIIGGRVGSTFAGCAGFIDGVRIAGE